MSIATRLLLLLTFVSALGLGVVWVYQPNTPMVHADHDDPYTTHLMRNPSGTKITDGRIVRNIIDRNDIPVCSDDYPRSAGFAATRWNAFFEYKPVFRVRDDFTAFPTNDPVCQLSNARRLVGVHSVVISYDDTECDYSACIYTGRYAPNEAWDSFTGQPQAYIGKYRERDSSTGVISRTHLLDNDARVTRSITHELGHVFGFGDYKNFHCASTPIGELYTFDYTTNPTVMSPGQSPSGSTGPCYADRPTSHQDELVYHASYIPEPPVVDSTVTPSSPREGVVKFVIDVAYVHVENKFEIQRRTVNDTWRIVDGHVALPLRGDRDTAQPIRVELYEQPPGLQVYRVVSKSNAPRLGSDVSASAEVQVVVKGPVPRTPSGLAGVALVNGISLTWDEAGDDPAIEGYEYRLNGGTWQTISGSGPDTKSYSLRVLALEGSQSVQIRSVRFLAHSLPSLAVQVTPLASCPAGHVPDANGFCIENKCVTQERPSTTVFTSTSTSTETRLVPVFVPPVFNCELFEEQRSVTTTTTYFVSYSCVDLCWQSTANVSVSTSYGQWSRTGNLGGPCNVRRSVSAGGTILPAGEYDLQWGEQRIRFTVPTGATVTLSGRQLDGGAYVAVLTLKKGQELVIESDAVSGDEQARTARFSSTTNLTLRSIADSLHDPSAQEPEANVTTTTQCAVAEVADDKRTSVDLDAESCSIVRDGGSVTVTRGGESHTFSLATGREWLVVDATGSSDAATALATFVDLSTGGYITLSLTDGAETSRHIPDGNTDLPALFDAMTASTPSEIVE